MNIKSRKKINLAMGLNKITRREFIEGVGVVIGTAALGYLPMTTACQGSKVSTSIPDESNTVPPPIPNTEASNTTSSSHTTTATLQSPNSSTGYKYTASNASVPLLDTLNCYTKVAADRLYSEEHIWVKEVDPGIIVMGISDKFSAILYKPKALSLISVGSKLSKGESFGSIEASKMNADLLSPVSGTVVDVDTFLLETQMKGVFEPVVGDPYGQGWMIAVKLSNPEELAVLMTAAQYLDLASSLETGG